MSFLVFLCLFLYRLFFACDMEKSINPERRKRRPGKRNTLLCLRENAASSHHLGNGR